MSCSTMRPSRSPGAPRRHRIRRACWCVLALTGATALSACTSEPPPLHEVWPDVSHKVEHAESVKITAEVSQDGQQTALELAGALDDSNYSGLVAEDKAHVEVRSVDGTTYLRANETFRHSRGGETFQDVDTERWIPMASEQDSGFAMSTFYGSFTAALPSDDAFADKQVEATTVRIDGQRVYKYSDVDTSQGEVALFIDEDDTLVRLEVDRDDDAPRSQLEGTIDFTEWNAVDDVEAPSGDAVYRRSER